MSVERGHMNKSIKSVQPIRVDNNRTDGCPICAREFYEKFNYCPDCGIKIDWGDLNERTSNV